MKFAVNLLLFVFISFLSVPTIVTLIEEKVDVSAFYSAAEEEIHKEIKQVKAEIKDSYNFDLTNYTYNSKTKIFSENQSNLDLISKEILIPPPKFI
jgi:hypothetical protein